MKVHIQRVQKTKYLLTNDVWLTVELTCVFGTLSLFAYLVLTCFISLVYTQHIQVQVQMDWVEIFGFHHMFILNLI